MIGISIVFSSYAAKKVNSTNLVLVEVHGSCLEQDDDASSRSHILSSDVTTVYVFCVYHAVESYYCNVC